MVKNPPYNAGDMGLTLGNYDPTRCPATKPAHHNYCSRTSQLESPCAAAKGLHDGTNIPCITNKTRGSQINKQTYIH